MKRYLSFVMILILSVVLFVSCGSAGPDENGFFQEVETASVKAQKKNQDIIVAITMADDDMYSNSVLDNILKTDEFKNTVMSEYAVVLMDFSQTSYEKTVVDMESSKKDQKAAQEYADVMQRNSQLASMLNVQSTPSFYILTKDKYYIAQLDYSEDVQTTGDFVKLLGIYDSEIQNVHNMVDATKKGSNLEKIAAIDELYEATDLTYRSFFADLIEAVIKLDKNNESGLVSKYLLANADVKGSRCYLAGDAKGAAEAYLKVCDEKYILPQHKQQAYYLGAYILAMSGAADYQTILSYLQSAIEAAPESDDVESIKMVYQYILNSVNAMTEGTLTPENQ